MKSIIIIPSLFMVCVYIIYSMPISNTQTLALIAGAAVFYGLILYKCLIYEKDEK